MHSLFKLKLSMITTLAAIFSITTLILTAILMWFGNLGFTALLFTLVLVVSFHIAQWLFAPYVIEALYKVRQIDSADPRYGWLVKKVEELALRSGINKPVTVGIASIEISNAFAYESPLTGPRIAVTERLLRVAPQDEIEAVLAHELGHIKHRDVAVMMVVSIIPALLYWLGNTMMRLGVFGSIGERRGSAPLFAIAIGAALIALTFVLNLVILYLSRLREYYADAHAVSLLHRGGTRLKRALTRILIDSDYLKRMGINVSRYSHLKALFISDPEVGLEVSIRRLTPEELDAIAEEIKSLPPKGELFSSHPHPAKRFRALEELELSLYSR